MSTSSKAKRMYIAQGLRVLFHVAVIALLTARSALIGNALHPYTRSLANEWVHLLYFVDTEKEYHMGAKTWTDTVTLPHFILEMEEEIAAATEDELYKGGFSATTSSYPIGLLFTIQETKKHLHGAIDNYFSLPNIALEKYIIADPNKTKDEQEIPLPELVIRRKNGTSSITHEFCLTGKNESEWPLPLHLNGSSHHMQFFFEGLQDMQLKFVVAVNTTEKFSHDHSKPFDGFDPISFIKWWIVFTYDLSTQGQLQLMINYGLLPSSIDTSNDKTEGLDSTMPIIFQQSQGSTLDVSIIIGILCYQSIELMSKWYKSQTFSLLLSPRKKNTRARRIWRIFKKESKDFWFWAITIINLFTLICFWQAWFHLYRLSLRDHLRFLFATSCALQWMTLIRYLRVTARFHILGLTLHRGLPQMIQFLFGVLPIFVGYVLFGTIMFGAKVPRFQSMGATATTLFSVANGDEIHDTFNSVAFTPLVGKIYIYSYMILFSYVVLMVCIGIIEDAFFSAVFPTSWPSTTVSKLRTDDKDAEEEKDAYCY
jgi:hypothetical protein